MPNAAVRQAAPEGVRVIAWGHKISFAYIAAECLEPNSPERANALLKSGWRALRRVTLCPRRIGTIIAAALVLTTMQRGSR